MKLGVIKTQYVGIYHKPKHTLTNRVQLIERNWTLGLNKISVLPQLLMTILFKVTQARAHPLRVEQVVRKLSPTVLLMTVTEQRVKVRV